MRVNGNHPLAEIIAKKLFGIGSVPANSDVTVKGAKEG